VLAFAYDTDAAGTITVRLYDPNWPDRDDVTLTLTPDAFRQVSGEPLFGLISLR
jgi:hypothetical protein